MISESDPNAYLKIINEHESDMKVEKERKLKETYNG